LLVITLDVKQQIIGSVLPEKLIFDKNQYRTQNMMSVVYKICSKINAFGAKKSGTEDKNLSLSHRVIPLGRSVFVKILYYQRFEVTLT
jgi:hypothetical protein